MSHIDEEFAALSTPHRRKIVEFLRTGAKSVGEVADHTECTQANTSHALKALLNAGIVKRSLSNNDARVHLFQLEDTAFVGLATWLVKMQPPSSPQVLQIMNLIKEMIVT